MALIDMMETFRMTNPGAHIDATDVYNSNDNLLDNAHFVGGGSQLGDGVFPINQRGQTSYSNGTNTTIDRWKTENSSISVDADGLTWTATGDNNQFEQITENYKLIEGETYTATIDCDILAGSARLFVGGIGYPWPTVAGSTVNVSSGITKVTFTFARESGYTGKYKFALASTSNGATVKLYACKLERGSISTLANDVPPDYGTELIKCRGYFERINTLGSSEIVGMGMGVSSSSVRIGIPSLICHTIQSVTYSGGGLLLEGGGNYRTLTSIGKLNATPKNGFLTVTCGSSDAITLYQTYALVGTAAGGYIDISAEP